MNIFPIIVESVPEEQYNIVEWMLSNTCNYNCSFCHSDFKSGDKKYLNIETYIDTCKRLIEQSNNKKVWFKLTGGEPTLYPKLIELLKFIKSTGNFTYIITNGSRTLRYWQELKEANCVDFIAVSMHPEQNADINHIIDVINVFKDTETIVTTNITCVPKYFNVALLSFYKIYKNCPTIVNLQQINDDSHLSKYTDIQIKTLLAHSNRITPSYNTKLKSNIPEEYKYHSGQLKFTYNDGSIKTDHAINFIKRGEDNFNGYLCDAGKKFIRISHEQIQRAICGEGKKWSIYDDTLFSTDSVECTRTKCDCTLDMIQNKKYNTNLK
jgi:organic radical activating enzyme